MSDTKTHTRHGSRAPRGSGSRPGGGRPGGPPGRGLSPATRGTLRGEPVSPDEVLPMGPTKTAPEAYAGLFRTALLLALSEGASLALARSRATLATWRSASGLSFEEAERARVETFAALLVERGEEHPTCAGLTPLYADPLPVEDEDGPRVPRGRSLPGDRIRRGGSR